MKEFKYKVLLPTSGTGSRLKELTKNLNKSLVPINGRATIDYILDLYPKDVPIVVTLGFLGQSVKDYLEENHKDRIFEFAWVDKYEGPGTSLGYSMLQAKHLLQCPFCFHGCDTIVTEKIPTPEKNWIGGYVEDWQTTSMKVENYDTVTVKDGKVTKLNLRGTPDFDMIYLGVDSIFDYEPYWKALEDLYKENPNDGRLNPVPILNSMLNSGIEFWASPYSVWLDTGNPDALQKTQEYLKKLVK